MEENLEEQSLEGKAAKKIALVLGGVVVLMAFIGVLFVSSQDQTKVQADIQRRKVAEENAKKHQEQLRAEEVRKLELAREQKAKEAEELLTTPDLKCSVNVKPIFRSDLMVEKEVLVTVYSNTLGISYDYSTKYPPDIYISRDWADIKGENYVTLKTFAEGCIKKATAGQVNVGMVPGGYKDVSRPR